MEAKIVKQLAVEYPALKASLCLAVLFIAFCGCFTESQAQAASRRSLPKMRVVIDASHDGGAWWFPQGPAPFDRKKPHQGDHLAAYLRGRGWQVIEIPRGAKIANQLKGAAIVVRMNVWGTYDQSEVSAYREFVRNGGRLLLVEGFVRENEAANDTVAEVFGLRFEGVISGYGFRVAEAGALKLDFNEVGYQIGSVVVRSPVNTQPLAHLNDGRLAMGMFRYGRGKVVFLSSLNPMLSVPQPFTKQLFDLLAR